jgi:XRE family aerobic/anaerobic benzoate catabolism transcriptional regulator
VKAKDDLLVEVGRRVRSRREALGLSQSELAERSDLSLRFLAQVEHGDGNISLVRFAQVARALGVGPADLLPRAQEGRPVVALLGVRGAGKSTIGPRLARRLGVPFVELDDRIVRAASLSLAEIFEVHGDPYYRRLQLETLARVLEEQAGKGAVIATGGSIVADAASFALLRGRAVTIWLRARARDHWRRVVAQGDRRPMGGNPRAFAELQALLRAREPLYRRAHHVVDTRLGVEHSVDEALRVVESGS